MALAGTFRFSYSGSLQDFTRASILRFHYSIHGAGNGLNQHIAVSSQRFSAGYAVSQYFHDPRFQVDAGYAVSQYEMLQDMASASTFLQDIASASTRNVLADAISCIDLRFGVPKVLAEVISCIRFAVSNPQYAGSRHILQRLSFCQPGSTG